MEVFQGIFRGGVRLRGIEIEQGDGRQHTTDSVANMHASYVDNFCFGLSFFHNKLVFSI